MLPIRLLACFLLLLLVPAMQAEEAGDHKQTGVNEGETGDNAAVAGNQAMDAITDVAGLPRVLLIGDSISLGYTVPTRQLLAGKANVHRVLRNCGASGTGFTGTRPGPNCWLNGGPWDVIHYNAGIWDTRLRPDKDGKAAVSTPNEQYLKNLSGVIEELKKTGATVIVATTTPIPEVLIREAGGPLTKKDRFFERIETKNELAVELLRSLDVRLNDLYAHIFPKRAEYWLNGGADLHFTPEGSAFLAEAVAKSIEEALTARAAGK
jgi:acyl-CoA thioesterase-1